MILWVKENKGLAIFLAAMFLVVILASGCNSGVTGSSDPQTHDDSRCDHGNRIYEDDKGNDVLIIVNDKDCLARQ